MIFSKSIGRGPGWLCSMAATDRFRASIHEMKMFGSFKTMEDLSKQAASIGSCRCPIIRPRTRRVPAPSVPLLLVADLGPGALQGETRCRFDCGHRQTKRLCAPACVRLPIHLCRARIWARAALLGVAGRQLAVSRLDGVGEGGMGLEPLDGTPRTDLAAADVRDWPIATGRFPASALL